MLRILNVEDDNDDFVLLRRWMEKLAEEEIEIVWSETAQAALQRINEESFDCVLCDYHMPGMDGLQLLKSLRQNGDEIPFILYTTDDDQQLMEQAHLFGANGVQVKEIPLSGYQRVLDRIREVVGPDTSDQG